MKNVMKYLITPVLKRIVSDETEGVPYWARRLNVRTQTPTFSGKDYTIFK